MNESIDIVVPMFNEEDVIPLLVQRLEDVFSEEKAKTYGLG